MPQPTAADRPRAASSGARRGGRRATPPQPSAKTLRGRRVPPGPLTAGAGQVTGPAAESPRGIRIVSGSPRNSPPPPRPGWAEAPPPPPSSPRRRNYPQHMRHREEFSWRKNGAGQPPPARLAKRVDPRHNKHNTETSWQSHGKGGDRKGSPTPRRQKRAAKEGVSQVRSGVDMAHDETPNVEPPLVGAPLPPWKTDQYVETSGAYAAPKNGVEEAKALSLRRKDGEPLGLTFDERLVVTHVTKGSAAHTAGIQIGSRIDAIGGKRVNSQADALSVFRSGCGEVKVDVFHPVDPFTRRLQGSPARRRAGLLHESELQQQRTREQLRYAQKNKRVKSPPRGVGVPGLGPQEGLGDAACGDSGWDSLHPGFKPNTTQPLGWEELRCHQEERIALTQSPAAGGCNRTSYEVAWERGQVDDDGKWRHKSPRQGIRPAADSPAAQHTPGLLHYHPHHPGYDGGGEAPPAVTPVRGRDRAAMPASLRQPAVGGAPDAVPSAASLLADSAAPRGGVKVPAQEFKSALLAHDAQRTDAAPPASPRRYGARPPRRNTSILAHHAVADPGAGPPQGLRTKVASWEHPPPPERGAHLVAHRPSRRVHSAAPALRRTDIHHCFDPAAPPRAYGKNRSASPNPGAIARGIVPGLD